MKNQCPKLHWVILPQGLRASVPKTLFFFERTEMEKIGPPFLHLTK